MNITRALVEKQREYLELGVRHRKPLSRAAIATELGVHESTVSRATAAKYVMTPDGEIIPFSHFFTPSLSIKNVIKEMVEKEGRPLTDAQRHQHRPTHSRQVPNAARHPAQRAALVP